MASAAPPAPSAAAAPHGGAAALSAAAPPRAPPALPPHVLAALSEKGKGPETLPSVAELEHALSTARERDLPALLPRLCLYGACVRNAFLHYARARALRRSSGADARLLRARPGAVRRRAAPAPRAMRLACARAAAARRTAPVVRAGF
jgi:hypothetical protein